MRTRRVARFRLVPCPAAGGFRTKAFLAFLLLAWSPVAARSQTIDDGIMMSKRSLCTGFLYMHDGWDQYWEGTLKRGNENVGTVTTQSVMWGGNYGVTDRLNVIAMAPYVWTKASGGTLNGQSGFSDLTLAAKYQVLETGLTSAGSFRAIVAASASLPVSDYVPDLLPLSIGINSKRYSGRLTLMFKAKRGWYLNGTGAYTWRDKVTLDRPAYFTDGQLFLSDQVNLPDVFDYGVSAGYMKPGLHIPVSFTQQITLGGGDIRRQDMPFVSNRMNVSRLDALVMYDLPMAKQLAVKVAGSYAVSGRNVGQATTVTAGLLYTFRF